MVAALAQELRRETSLRARQEQEARSAGWVQWVQQALARGAKAAHTWTREPAPWQPELVDEEAVLRDATAGGDRATGPAEGELAGALAGR